jgi:hypothetical protein
LTATPLGRNPTGTVATSSGSPDAASRRARPSVSSTAVASARLRPPSSGAQLLYTDLIHTERLKRDP